MITATKVRNRLRGIPENKMIEHWFTDERGKCCVAGHLNRLFSKNPKDYSNTNCNLSHNPNKEIQEFCYYHPFYKGSGMSYNLVKANNGDHPSYNQPTPKKRVMAMLKDMIASGY